MGNLSELIDEPKTNEAVTDKKPSGPTDLSELLSGYKEPAIVEPEPVITKPVEVVQPEIPKINPLYPGMPHWYGNPMYYQSGKKQGQLKPPPKKGFGNAFQQPQMSVSPETSVMTADAIISGAMFLTIINLLIPMLFALVNNLVVKDKKKVIDWEMLQIDDKAGKQLEDLAGKALKQIKIDANPLGVFLFALCGMYAMQFLTVKMLVDAQSKIKDNGKNNMATDRRP